MGWEVTDSREDTADICRAPRAEMQPPTLSLKKTQMVANISEEKKGLFGVLTAFFEGRGGGEEREG